jgi:hypothetical protein
MKKSSCVHNQIKEDIKVLKLRYPLVTISKIKNLNAKYGAVVTNDILSDDYHLYELAMEMGFPSLEVKGDE